jgi:BlaI family transcriptional regulator, penicillinase repressor
MRLRGLGELERAIMEAVWAAEGPVTGRAVVDELTRDRPVAYTTVLTVMDRLVRKGMLTRQRRGRAHTYRAARSRAAYTGDLMASVLGSSDDRSAVLLHFVEHIPPDQAEALRAALDAARVRSASRRRDRR